MASSSQRAARFAGAVAKFLAKRPAEVRRRAEPTCLGNIDYEAFFCRIAKRVMGCHQPTLLNVSKNATAWFEQLVEARARDADSAGNIIWGQSCNVELILHISPRTFHYRKVKLCRRDVAVSPACESSSDNVARGPHNGE